MIPTTATDSVSSYQAAHHNLDVYNRRYPDDQLQIRVIGVSIVRVVEFTGSVSLCFSGSK